MNKYKSGSGWHYQSVRHSLARKFGHAGGRYADDLRHSVAINSKDITQEVSQNVNKLKQDLINKAMRSGIYENFGQKEVRKLMDKYSDLMYGTAKEREAYNLVSEFEYWAMNFDDRKLEYERKSLQESERYSSAINGWKKSQTSSGFYRKRKGELPEFINFETTDYGGFNYIMRYRKGLDGGEPEIFYFKTEEQARKFAKFCMKSHSSPNKRETEYGRKSSARIKGWDKISQGKYEIQWTNWYQHKRGGSPTNVFIERAKTPDLPLSKYDVWVVHKDGGVIISHATSLKNAKENAIIYLKNHPRG